MMEVRYRLVQTTAGQVGKRCLEGAEGLGGGVSLFRRTHDIMPRGAFDEVVAAPAITGGVDVPGFAGKGRNESERASFRVGIAGFLQLGVGVGADAFHVGHQFVRSAEDVVVDALKHEATRAAGRLHVYLEGVVDMSAAVGGGRQDLAGEGEFARDRDGIMSFGGGHHQAQREEG